MHVLGSSSHGLGHFDSSAIVGLRPYLPSPEEKSGCVTSQHLVVPDKSTGREHHTTPSSDDDRLSIAGGHGSDHPAIVDYEAFNPAVIGDVGACPQSGLS